MARKPKIAGERSINAGISLPPRLIDQARDAAKFEGFETLTNLVRYLLTQHMQELEKKWEREEIEREKFKSAELQQPPKPRGRPRKD